ncbi:AP-1 complex subunit gamma-2 [Auxenochlorella protothecoides]|uniref:AP-1 complex subunit gamma n=1 Tax=Auxenochlorella protothecoides TaxID=3075 RepID=A0A087SSU5_AUXPR|nr:AP-1 complex subunit gamma-2 [Auxenochlorella protothecoides]KFM28799.1 AP-1 complex subunit gamma-2 [Auxenochlorella protothecoides]
MTMRLRDLIKHVRAAKTAAEERNVIAKESAALRKAFKEQDSTYRHRNVAKLMYIHMLGYPTHFGQMETLKLIASLGFPEKASCSLLCCLAHRLGYLGLMLLLDERQEVLMLVTNSLKNDLHNRNMLIQGLALCALGNICSAEMARDLAPEVEKLMGSINPYLRKKAALCASRVLRKVPEMLEPFAEQAVALLSDRNHGVMLAGVTLMLEMCHADPAVVTLFRPQVPRLASLLRSLLGSQSYATDTDVSGLTDPFLQVKLLRLLRELGRGDAESSDAMGDVLAAVASNTESTRNAGNAILYECVQTIMAVESIGGLRVLAVNTLGRFLAHRDNNIRYVALHTLARVAARDPGAVQRHRATVVDCVRDADASIRRAALELVYSLVNEGNIRELAAELLDYLAVCDPGFKPDLAAKICVLVGRHAPDKRWYLDSMAKVLRQAGAFVTEEAVAGLAGDRLVEARGRLEGEDAAQVSAQEAFDALRAILTRHGFGDCVLARTIERVNGVTLTALAKLGVRLPALAPQVAELLDRFSRAPAPEVQTRAVEYARLAAARGGLAGAVLEPIPAAEGGAGAEDLALVPAEGEEAAGNGGGTGGAGLLGADPAADLAALLGLDAGAPAATNLPAPGAAPALAGWSLQAAVPRFATLRLSPPSGTSLAGPGQELTQRLHVVNSAPGTKPLVLRLRLAFQRDGAGVTDQVEVGGFPPGF